MISIYVYFITLEVQKYITAIQKVSFYLICIKTLSSVCLVNMLRKIHPSLERPEGFALNCWNIGSNITPSCLESQNVSGLTLTDLFRMV